MAKVIATMKAIVTRLIFASHGFIAIWQVTTFKKNSFYWYLCCPIILLFFEGLITITIKTNQEWKWFCPSVFLYLASVVPAIWLLELDKLGKRIKTRGSNFNISETLDLTNLATEDLKHLEKIFGVDLKLPEIKISTETWVTLIEQFLMLVLIIGRWMLPKGDLTRDQLSQLLLVYIGTAADIIEFFDSFKEDKIGRELILVYLTLGIWSWSLIQFTVVLTATKSRKSRLSSGTAIKYKVTAKTSCCSIDVWAIAINMILQDAPFLAFRLIIIIHYQISVNKSKKKKTKRQHERRQMLSNISIISKNDLYKYDNDKSRKRRQRHIEDIESDSDYSLEQQEICELSPRHFYKSKRQIRQDVEYPSSSAHGSVKFDNISKNKNKRTTSPNRNVSIQRDITLCDDDIKKILAKTKIKSIKLDEDTRQSKMIKNKRKRNNSAIERNVKSLNYQTSDDLDEENECSSESEADSQQRYSRCRHTHYRV